MLLVDEGRSAEVFRQRGAGCHLLERLFLPLVLPSLACEQPLCSTYLASVLVGGVRRHRQLGPSRYQIDDARRTMFDLIQQSRSIGFELEAVCSFYQRHLLARHDVLAGNVTTDRSEYFCRRQFVSFPLLILFVGAAFGRPLIAELGHQRFVFRQMLPQPGVRFKLVEVLREPILECLRFLLVEAVCLAQQVEPLRLFHLPNLGDASAQHFRIDEIVVPIGLHFDMFGLSKKDHDLRGESFDTDRGEGVLGQEHLSDERKLRIDACDAGLLPELALQERARHDEHQYPRRIQYRISFVHVILLRKPIVETQVERRISDNDVESFGRIVLPDVARLDMGIGIEVAGDGDRFRIDVETVGVMQIRQVVEEITHPAAHVEDHLRGRGRQQPDHLPAHLVRREELADFGLFLGFGIVVIGGIVRLPQSVQAADAGITIIDARGRNVVLTAVDSEKDLLIDLGASLLRNMLRDNRVIHGRQD